MLAKGYLMGGIGLSGKNHGWICKKTRSIKHGPKKHIMKC